MLKSQNFKLAELKYKPVARISQKEFNINGVGDNQSGGFGAQLPENLNISTAVIKNRVPSSEAKLLGSYTSALVQ